MPEAHSAEEKVLKSVVNTFDELNGDFFIFNPMYPYQAPKEEGPVYWELGPEGSAAREIMNDVEGRGMGSGYYMGCARHGKDGNASALPFMPEETEWKKADRLGNISEENCMACEEFGDWWFQVQQNTIEKYGLKFWSWDPGPGNGKFCYSDQHGHLPGKGDYKGWRDSTRLLAKMKAANPGIFLLSFYGRKEYGLWGFKYFDAHESYWELTVPYGSSIHPDLHADRVNADGVRIQNWWNQNFRFLPPQINFNMAHRVQEGEWDIRLPKAWDHTGWKYSIMSALAGGGKMMTTVLPEDLDAVPEMKAFYAKWLKWAKDNFHLDRYNIPFGEQLRIGGVDGWSRIQKQNGFIFLCNPNPRPTKITFALDDTIGLNESGQYTLQELYPEEGPYFLTRIILTEYFGNTTKCPVLYLHMKSFY